MSTKDYAYYYRRYSSVEFFVGTDRYGHFGSVVVCVISHDEDYCGKVREAVENLEGGDNESFDARDFLKAEQKAGNLTIGTSYSFAKAAKDADDQFKAWLDNVLRKL